MQDRGVQVVDVCFAVNGVKADLVDLSKIRTAVEPLEVTDINRFHLPLAKSTTL